MLDIWRRFGHGIGSIIDEIKEGLGKRGLVAFAFGAIAGIAVTASLVWSMYASKGCSPEFPFWEAIGKGLAALFMGCLTLVVGGFILGLLLHIPDGIMAVVDGISEWQSNRKRRREQGLPPADSPGIIRNWILFFGSLAIGIIAIGFSVGYIAWLIVC